MHNKDVLVCNPVSMEPVSFPLLVSGKLLLSWVTYGTECVRWVDSVKPCVIEQQIVLLSVECKLKGKQMEPILYVLTEWEHVAMWIRLKI